MDSSDRQDEAVGLPRLAFIGITAQMLCDAKQIQRQTDLYKNYIASKRLRRKTTLGHAMPSTCIFLARTSWSSVCILAVGTVCFC